MPDNQPAGAGVGSAAMSGAVVLLALADPAPNIATMIVLLLILGTLLNNWPVYKAYIGLK